MTLRAADLITEPCSERWDAMDGAGARRMCARCSKTVVDLSGMTEAEVRAHAKPGMCIRVPTDDLGNIRVAAAPLVPLSRLRVRPAPAIAAAAIAMAIACTPHVRPEAEPEPAPISVVAVEPEPSATPKPVVVEVPSAEARRRADSGHTMGAVMGKPVYKLRPVHYAGPQRGGVMCDTLSGHPLGSPANLDEGRGLVPAKALEKADLLARCDP